MLNILIIEDEPAAQQQLLSRLDETGMEINILASLGSVRESMTWLEANPSPDLVFSDVQLGDGLSFSIFEQLSRPVPVIYTTGYNHFMLEAFAQLGIDYLLKPVSGEKLEKALKKFRVLENHFNRPTVRQILDTIKPRQRSRFLVRKGNERLLLHLDDIVLFYSETKLVYVIDQQGGKFLADGNLGEIAKQLDPSQFFRVNRQYIVNIRFIRGFRTFERVKLQLDMSIAVPEHELVISQETAPQFRNWMQQA